METCSKRRSDLKWDSQRERDLICTVDTVHPLLPKQQLNIHSFTSAGCCSDYRTSDSANCGWQYKTPELTRVIWLKMAHLYCFRTLCKVCRSNKLPPSPVSHLLPFPEHPPGGHLDGQVEALTEVADNTLVLQQQRHSVDWRDILDTNHLETITRHLLSASCLDFQQQHCVHSYKCSYSLAYFRMSLFSYEPVNLWIMPECYHFFLFPACFFLLSWQTLGYSFESLIQHQCSGLVGLHTEVTDSCQTLGRTHTTGGLQTTATTACKNKIVEIWGSSELASNMGFYLATNDEGEDEEPTKRQAFA